MKRARFRGHLPRAWLFTDERLGGASPDDPLWAAIARLPRGDGILVRHYSWPETERRRLLAAVRRVARPRGLIVVASGIGGRADGTHRGRRASDTAGLRPRRFLVTASAHGERDVMQAFARGAMLVFLSPVFPTASHPSGRTLGPVRFGLAVRRAPGPVLALGGMDAARARRMRALGAAGFGAIDAWLAE